MFDSNSNNALNYIREGMDVYDLNHEKVGTVNYVQVGDENPNSLTPETRTATNPPLRDDSLVDEFAQALFSTDDFPEVIRSQMIRNGFIRIDTGFLQRDCFATGEHIASVGEGQVDLNITREELIYPQ